MKERLNGQFSEVVALLGDPPDMSNLTEEFWRGATGKMLTAVRPELEALALQAGEQMIATGVGIAWDLVAEQAAVWATEHAGRLISGVTETTRRNVGLAVERYFRESGTTTGDLQRDIQSLRKGLEPWFSAARAESIAVTEVTTAAAEGGRVAAQVARDAGYTLEPVWHTNRDEVVCTICGPNDGKRRSEGWTVGQVPAHPRCRCFETYEVLQ